MPTLVTFSVGATARDYATVQALVTDIGVGISGDLVADDENWIIEWYNDAEFTYTTNQDFKAALPAGKTDATRNIVMRPAAGEGFLDSITASDALKYWGVSKGVAIRATTNNGRSILHCTFMDSSGFQFTRGTSSGATSISNGNIGSGSVKNCLIDGNIVATNTTVGSMRNIVENLVVFSGITSGRALDFRGGIYKNITVIRYSDADASSTEVGIENRFSGGATLDNCVSVGFATDFLASASYTLTKCASSDATGSSGLTGLTAGDLFEGLASSAPDARIKSTGALDDAGGAGGTSTDILGTSRVGNGDIGAFELVAAGGSVSPWYYYAQQAMTWLMIGIFSV